MTDKLRTAAEWQMDSRRFDGVADEYDVYRPAYPEELIEALISLTDLRPESKILEVGSGTGKATLLLAQRGFSIKCIEHGQQLVAVAARKLKQFPRVEFETVAFEQWPVRPNEFDLLLSAQAFHWVPREIAYARAAQALKQHGHLALFWNCAKFIRRMHPSWSNDRMPMRTLSWRENGRLARAASSAP